MKSISFSSVESHISENIYDCFSGFVCVLTVTVSEDYVIVVTVEANIIFIDYFSLCKKRIHISFQNSEPLKFIIWRSINILIDYLT